MKKDLEQENTELRKQLSAVTRSRNALYGIIRGALEQHLTPELLAECEALKKIKSHAARQAVPALIEEVDRLSGLRGPVDALERVLELEAQLAAMTAARDEACDLLSDALGPMHPSERLARIAALRKVGQ